MPMLMMIMTTINDTTAPLLLRKSLSRFVADQLCYFTDEHGEQLELFYEHKEVWKLAYPGEMSVVDYARTHGVYYY